MTRVIIIDDEVLARIGIRTFLDGKEGITVCECFSDAKEALEYLERRYVDVVITDIEMEEMDGLSLIDRIRRGNLAGGVIIVSSHDDFQYARRALELKANLYLLKQELTEDALLSAVREVARASQPQRESAGRRWGENEDGGRPTAAAGERYYAAALRLLPEQGEESAAVNRPMLNGLLENLLRRYPFGELFVAGTEEPFLLLHFPADGGQGGTEQEAIARLCEDLAQNVRLYTNHTMAIGLSEEFDDLGEVRARYRTAAEAAEQSFYQSAAEQNFYQGAEAPYYEAALLTREAPHAVFSADMLLEEDGEAVFAEELHTFLKTCGQSRLTVSLLRQALISMVNVLVYRVLHSYHFSEEITEKWEQNYQYMQIISEAATQAALEARLAGMVGQLRLELLTQLRTDEFSGVYRYVDEHMNDKISLQELAEMSSMSTAVFCRKFKERTGATLVEYLNERRIELVKRYLTDERLSLEEIAEKTGFSSANYMVRVFKKVTGSTVREYRKEGEPEKILNDE